MSKKKKYIELPVEGEKKEDVKPKKAEGKKEDVMFKVPANVVKVGKVVAGAGALVAAFLFGKSFSGKKDEGGACDCENTPEPEVKAEEPDDSPSEE